MARSTRRTRALVTLTAALSLTVGGLLGPSAATAAPGTAAQAEKLVEQAAQKLTRLDEQLHQAKITVQEQQAAARDAKGKAAEAEARLAALEPQLRSIAQTGYTGRQSRVATFLTSESADDLVRQMTTLDMIATHTETVVAAAAAAQKAAEKAEAAAEAAVATARAGLAELKKQQQEVQRRQKAYEAAFNRLTAAQRSAVTRAVAGPTLAAPSTADAVAQAPNAAAATVIKTALAQLGDTYVWGAAGPDSFDCSGLTMFAYAAAGVSLPHSSQAQFEMGTPVSRADLQPGDLVFFYSPIGHVAIYIGGGKMVHARTFGQPVSVTSVDMAGYAGARRILN